ncbi:MAG: tyrosine-type recombinase/integrase [Candidatus Dadabacteria bacterium]|nr:tyrosine-type recombinase/integrase [Candidatus Dadabacteria bacterium]
MQPTGYGILKTRLSTAGVAKVRIHGFRRGTAEVLLKAGAGLPEVMQTGRWKSSRMVSVYTSDLDAESGAVA